MLQESDGAGVREVRRTKFPVSSARLGYFQIEAGQFFSLFFYATRRKFEFPNSSPRASSFR